MADEYIDKVEVGAKIQMMYIRREMDYGGENDFCRGMRKALRIIENMPAADVQPIRHGRWIDCTFYDPCEKSWEQNYEFKCSNCEHKIYNKPNDDNLFCGHCSARMDGGAEND